MNATTPADNGQVRAECTYRCEGAVVRVRVCGPDAVAALAAVFPDYRLKTADPSTESGAGSAPRPDLELLPAPNLGWTLNSFGTPDPTPEGRDLPAVFGRMERQLADLLALGTRPALLIHAGGAVVGGQGVLLAGPSGSGKSSLSTALAVAGCRIWGDDAVVLNRDGQARPFKRLLKLHAGAREALALDPPAGALAALYPEASFFHPRDLGTSWAEPAPVNHVVFVRRGGAGVATSSLSAAEGVRGLLDLALGPADRATSLAGLVEAVQHVTFSSLRFDRCDLAAAELIRRLA